MTFSLRFASSATLTSSRTVSRRSQRLQQVDHPRQRRRRRGNHRDGRPPTANRADGATSRRRSPGGLAPAASARPSHHHVTSRSALTGARGELSGKGVHPVLGHVDVKGAQVHGSERVERLRQPTEKWSSTIPALACAPPLPRIAPARPFPRPRRASSPAPCQRIGSKWSRLASRIRHVLRSFRYRSMTRVRISLLTRSSSSELRSSRPTAG